MKVCILLIFFYIVKLYYVCHGMLLTLNILNPSDDINVVVNEVNGVSMSIYTPKYNNFIELIQYYDNLIWSSKNGDVCISAIMHTNKIGTSVLTIEIKPNITYYNDVDNIESRNDSLELYRHVKSEARTHSRIDESSENGMFYIGKCYYIVHTAYIPVALDASSNYFTVTDGATPRDRSEDEGSDGSSKGSDGSSIMGMMEDGAKDVLDVTSSGLPVADLREAEGEVNREASTASGITSSVQPVANIGESDGQLNRDAYILDNVRISSLINDFVRNYNLYYFRDKLTGNWNIINNEEYVVMYFKLCNEYELDINNCNTLCNTIIFWGEYGNNSIKMNIKEGYIITCIKLNNNIIWRSDNINEKCLKLLVNYRKNNVKLIQIIITNNKIIFEKYFYLNNNNNWIETDENIHKNIKNILENEFELDILSTNLNNNIILYKFHPYGLNCNIFTVKYNFFIFRVIDNDLFIWESNDINEYCIDVCIYSNHFHENILCQLFITNQHHHYYKFFQLINQSEWVEINTDLFYQLLNIYDNIEDNYDK